MGKIVIWVDGSLVLRGTQQGKDSVSSQFIRSVYLWWGELEKLEEQEERELVLYAQFPAAGI